MTEPLSRILYCSKNLIQGSEQTQADVLAGIQQTARTRNAAQGVTGALLYNSGYFAQVLEGPKTAIEATFERIQRDQRHGDVTVLEFAESDTRDFAEWSMAHVAPVTGLQSAVAGDTLFRAMATPQNAGNDVLELLRSLVNQED